MAFAISSSYLCDTIPAPDLASSVELAQVPEDIRTSQDVIVHTSPGRKLCPRHQRMADEGINLKLQQALDALPLQDREAVNTIWSNFSSSPHSRRSIILHGLLTMCCFSQLSLLSEQLAHLIRIDPFAVLPREISLKILAYLDAISLGRAAQVNRQWRTLADDDVLWRSICEQHIGQKCAKCGWGLPRLDRKKKVLRMHSPPSPLMDLHELLASSSSEKKRQTDDEYSFSDRPLKRHKSDEPLDFGSDVQDPYSAIPSPLSTSRSNTPLNPLVPLPYPVALYEMVTRPWKDVYCERLAIERNWRRGRCTFRIIPGHKDGVMCLQINENLSHPSFSILITGSYDRTVRVWNFETGAQIHCLEGHTDAVRALQFDEIKLVTGSMDSTIKIWNWRTGVCLRTLEGHSQGVICLNFDADVLASGSIDGTIKIWNFRNGERFTLRGHRNWVNSVLLWDSNKGPDTSSDLTPSLSQNFDWSPGESGSNNPAAQINPGKMLFSASDDGTIRIWDLALRSCVRQCTGHVCQVQTLGLVYLDRAAHNNADVEGPARSDQPETLSHRDSPQRDDRTESLTAAHPVLISGSLDNTIKLWDINTGKAWKTLFGHIEGVWAVASDKMRIISGSHDRTIKVWNCEDGKCTATLVGHRGAVTCLALGDDKIVSGSDDGDIRVWSFSE